MKVKILFENHKIIEGENFGYPLTQPVLGEMVFNTAMTGYQEILTDPSYAQQIVVMTFPEIGIYGISPSFFESMKPELNAFIVKDYFDHPSHHESNTTLDHFLKSFHVPGIKNIDTRDLTLFLRDNGNQKSIIVPEDFSNEKALDLLSQYEIPHSHVQQVSTKRPMRIPGTGFRVVLMDFGYKKSILTALLKRNCDVTIVPYNYSVDQILSFSPKGILLSNGPGDPMDLPKETLLTIASLQEKIPLMGICLGHQLLALANGLQTQKLKFGHRGANHPVLDIDSQKIFMTSQNHGYTVLHDATKPSNLRVSQINLNDKSIEGLKHLSNPVFSVQYHPEANPGPQDTAYLFDHFINAMKESNHA